MPVFPPFNTHRTRRARSLVIARGRVLPVLLLAILWSGATRAQGVEGDLIYKFSVEGVHHRAEAKPLLYALTERSTVHACDFIEECACFKLASSVPLDYAALEALVRERKHRLSGAVEVSDGDLLLPQSTPQR